MIVRWIGIAPARGGSTVAEHSPFYPEVKGLSPATAGENGSKVEGMSKLNPNACSVKVILYEGRTLLY